MKIKLVNPTKPLILFFLLVLFSFSAYSQAKNAEKEPAKIDTSPFYSSTNQWYTFDYKDWVVSRLPGNPQHDETEIESIADNILLFQRDNGGWPKNYDMRAILNEEQKEKLKAAKPVLATTFDNSTTYTQVHYLAQAYTLTKINRYKEGCLKGLDFMLEAQYDNGGWPQYYPNRPENSDYSTQITFNDDGYTGIMNVLKTIIDKDPSFAFVDNTRRKKVKEAYDKGLEMILKTQIAEDGKKKVWCQQYDEVTLEPVWARTFEPPCFSNQESAPIVMLLMDIENPSDEAIASIQGAVKYFEESKILNTRSIDDPTAPIYVSKVKVHKFDRRVVYDLLAPPIWSRYTEFETGRPIFCDRSSEIVYNMSDLSRERRSGYGWYTYAPQEVLDKYPEWQKAWAKENNVLEKSN